jgi:type I pantothenate kinase
VTPIAPAGLAARLAAHRQHGEPLVVGITGPVAVGKTTLARQIADALAQIGPWHVEIVSTDGFLLPNAVLEARGISHRKGFPESFDTDAMAAALAGLKSGPVAVPAYSHVTYDVDPAAARTIAGADIVLVEGLGLAPGADGQRPPLDLLVYIDAEEADVLAWFLDRFMGLWAAAATDPTSFYARFRHMDEAAARDFALQVWNGINRPNWLDHIAQAKPVADIVVKKAAHHRLFLA